MKKQKYKLLIIFLIFSCFLGFFDAKFAIVSDIIILCAIFKTINVQGCFRKIMLFFVLFLLCSVISCYIYEKQSFWLSITNLDFIAFFPFLSYFYMIKKRNKQFTINDIEWNIRIFYIVIFFLFMIQYIILPHQIIHLSTFIEGEKRFTIYGQIITLIAYFYYLNRYLITNRNKYLFFLLPELLIVFIQGFRSYIVVLIGVSILFLLNVGKLKKIVVLALVAPILALLIIQLPIVNNAISNMQNRQVEDNFSNEDYIRVRQFEYFTKEHFKSPVEYLFGSGFSNPRSSYGKKMLYLGGSSYENQTGPIGGWRDWGLVGLSWIIGLPCFLCILFCILKILLTKIPKQYLYLKYFYIFILFTSVTSVEFYRWGSVFMHGVLFYLFEQIIKEKEYLLNEKKNIICSK